LVYGSDEATPPPAAAFASSLVGRLPVPTRSSNEWAWISSSSSWLEPRLVPDHTTSLELPTAAIAKRGLNSLEAAPLPDFDSTLAQRLDDDSVLVCVQAAGINFHDVVFATYGATSEAMDDGSALGVDFSGVVQAVGSKVDHVRPGDSVFGMADGSIRSVLVCHGSLLRKLEPGCGLSVQEAASLPTIFATAHFILRHVADVRAGQTMLIHTATGGLGHVLVHMAQDLGARVVATAGSEEKQRYLADELGVDPGLIATSRDAGSFSERLGHLVSQVDVAINTLSGDYIPETLSLLKPGGMFFETGKLAIWTPEEVKSSRPDVEYHVVHLTQPELLSQFLGDLKDALSQGAVRAPRIESFQYPAQLKEAFEHVRNAQHIGKVVLTMPDAPGKRILCPLQSSVDDAVRRGDENRVRDDATYIVTGGNSGLGLVAARVLVDAGALHIVLLSRSGVVRDLDAHVHAEIEKVAAQTGCNLQHWACDVGDKAELGRLRPHPQTPLVTLLPHPPGPPPRMSSSLHEDTQALSLAIY
jgi:NADPH:quinone reductase-like Zn-dependent oxidoreductase